MAFNPFHRFRKHQRAILAVVTIALMLVFGLTWGMGDITRYFTGGGGPGSTGPQVTTFKFSSSWFSTQTKVYQGTVDNEVRQRKLANDFILFVVANGTRDAMAKLAPTPQNPFQPPDPKSAKYPAALASYIQNRDFRNSQFGQMMPLKTRLQQIEADIEAVARLRQNPPLTDKDNEARVNDLVQACDTLLGALRFELWVSEQQQKLTAMAETGQTGVADFYFGGTGSLDDTLDFMLWKHQAKRLGITYTENDVRKAINRLIGADGLALTGNLLDNTYVSQFFKQQRFRNQEAYIDSIVKELTDALADEFRVQTAQEALIGYPLSAPSSFFVTTGIYQPTVSVTPDEFLNYVRNQRTSLKLAMLQVPLTKFVDPNDKVSEQRLRDVYEQYRGVEPSPERSTPGFKIPRKVRVEYATGDPESPYFKEVAKGLALQPTVLRVTALASTYPAGGGALGWGVVTGVPYVEEPLLKSYQRYQQTEEFDVLDKKAVSPAIYDRKYNAATLVGEVLGSLQQTGPLAVPVSLEATNAVNASVVAKAVGSTVLGATSPTSVAVAMLPYPYTHTVQPLSEVEGFLFAQETKKLAEGKVAENLTTFAKEVDKISTGAKPNELAEKVKEYLLKAPKELGLVINGMTAAKDRYALADDAALKVFKEQYDKLKAEHPNERIFDFAELFLAHHGVYRPQPNPLAQFLGSSIADARIWLAEDIAAHEIPFDQAEPEVLAAQRMIDARTRALKYVLTLTDQELKDHKWPPDFQTREKEVKSFLEAQKQGRVFELDNVSRLWTPDSLPNMTAAERPYYAYKVPESDFPYPPANLVDRLMSLHTPGEAVFLKDRPEKNFYVAVLLERSVPTLEDFKKVYENADNLLLRDPLWDNCVRDQREQFTKQFIRHMREEWTGELDDKGRIHVPKDVRDKYDKTER